MTSEFLLDAIGLLDDDLIQDAEVQTAPVFSLQDWFRRHSSLVACLVLVVVLGFFLSQGGRGGSSSSMDAASAGAPESMPSSSATSDAADSSGNGHELWGDGSPCMKDELLLVVVPMDGKKYSFIHYYGEDRTVDVLPEGCHHIGKVETWSETSTAPYTDYDVYLGCELWLLEEEEDKTLYLELPEGGYLECAWS